MPEVVLCIGSNSKEAAEAVGKASYWLRKECLRNCKTSEIYETEAVGKPGMPSYSNCVVSGFFNGEQQDLQFLLKDYEIRAGRDENARLNGLVPIDIDIVICDSRIIKPWDFKQKFFKIGYAEINSFNV